jgi:3-hydroxybutyryl-CoA dehydratase
VNNFSFSDISVGLEKSFVANIDEAKMNSFLVITGDNNPLHVNAEFAKERGFLDKVCYGMLTSSFYSTLVGVYLPGRHAILHGIDIQFMKPVYSGDTLTIIGKVSYMNEAYKQIEVKAQILNQHSIKISKALIKIGISNG